jgi:phosphoribosylaminoimidazole-succinocarboxamide synthase
MTNALHTSALSSLTLLARGKVRDNYAVGNDRILMVASDRLSAFDVIMGEPIPGKGALLTKMALFWFDKLGPKGLNICPIHLTGDAPESVVTPAEVPQVVGRSMLVKRLKPLPVEAVVRGYLAGSGWKEYQDNGAVCGVKLPAGLKNASRLPEPIYTPAAKAAVGDHDENITFEQTVEMIGLDLATRIRDRVCSDQRHHHCRHQIRVWSGQGWHFDPDGRGADAGFFPLLAGRKLPGRDQPAQF